MIYLDNCATTPLDDCVAEAMLRAGSDHFGNPSSIHAAGRRAAKVLLDSRAVMAKSIGARPDEIVLTSSGSEANNMVVGSAVGNCAASGSNHILISAIEHASVYKTAEYYASRGELRFDAIGVDGFGRLRAGDLESAVTADTRLLSVIHCNNETGVLQDLEALFAFKLRHPTILLHLDIVQSYLKHDFDVRTMPVDFLTTSAHKLHGPKGIGFCYIRSGVEAGMLIVGGSQEKFRRAGTENVAAAVGYAEAIRRHPEPAKIHEEFRTLEMLLLSELKRNGARFSILGPPESGTMRMPGILNLGFEGVRNKEDLQIACDLEGLMLSSTSACHSGVVADSHVLQAMNIAPEKRAGSIRICFNRFNTPDEIRLAAGIISKAAHRLGELAQC
jgi:cysteine desulfurase